MAGIKGYRPSKQAKKLHAARSGEKPPGYINNTGEAEVVFGEQLSVVLKEWQKNWLQERNPHIERNFADDRSKVIGPVGYLQQWTGIDERRLYGLIRGEYKFVPSTQAELILMVIDKEYMFGTLIHVIPNPRWSPERWAEYMKERGCF